MAWSEPTLLSIACSMKYKTINVGAGEQRVSRVALMDLSSCSWREPHFGTKAEAFSLRNGNAPEAKLYGFGLFFW